MGPSRALRLVARDRARRNPGSRPAHAAIHQGNAWWDAKLVSILGTGSAAAEAKGAAPNREAGPPGLLIALVAAVAVNCGAGLGLAGWGTLQALGVVAEPAMETVQRQQASLIAQLGAAVQELKAAVAGIGARVYSAEDRDEANTRRMAELDAALGVLRSGLDEMRAAQAAEQSWREPVAELTAAAAKARGEIVRLRASLDELSKSRQPEVVAIQARIDRMEQAMLHHHLLGAIRGAIREPAVHLASPAPENSPAANGHIISLTPAH